MTVDLFDCMTVKTVAVDLFIFISCGVVRQSQQNQESDVLTVKYYCYILVNIREFRTEILEVA